jgi:hypothetical protein
MMLTVDNIAPQTPAETSRQPDAAVKPAESGSHGHVHVSADAVVIIPDALGHKAAVSLLPTS